MNNYEDNILKAIETIVDSSIAKTDYDRTIQATIIKIIDKALGQYNVKYQDSYFDAFTADTAVEYLEGTNVYILVPNGDMSKDKTILGAVDGYRVQGVTAITDADASDPVGYNCVNGDTIFELCSYTQEQSIILYDKDDNIDLIGLDNTALKNFLLSSSYLVAGASFRTNLPGEQKLKGNYGIIFELGFKTQVTDEIVFKKFIVDINRMSGNPYNLISVTPQLGYFEIDGENFEYVNNITIFEKDFPNQAVDKDNDIFISELQIFGANRISEEEYNVARLVINTPQGNYFTEQDSLQTTKQLVAKIKVNGDEIDLSKAKVEYYWFKENDDITIENQKYNLYGGEGWECLNDFTLVDNDNPDLVKWTSATNIWNVAKASIRSEKVQYKCIVIYNDMILQRLTTISNQGAATSIKIVSDLGVDFIDGLGYPSLTCMINNSEEPLTGYRYVWSRVDNNGLYLKLEETTTQNTAYQEAYNNYYNLLNQIETEQVFPNAVAAQLEQYKEDLDAFEIVTRIDKNKIYNINTSEITNYMHYKCSVYYNNEYVGTESIVLYNTNSNNQDYFIELINGTQIFKYDENGLSPCDSTKENPQELLPITFNIINKNGLDVTDELLNKSQIEWSVPTENTLITADGSLQGRFLNFTIDNFYDNTKTNNEIQLIVSYKKQKLISYTGLSFIKEGDIGTNGTDYYCKIIPNTSQKVDYPMIINGNLNYTPAQVGKWFKAQIWRGGKLIFEGTDSGASIETDRAIIRWGVQKNKYNAQISDPSTISVINNTFSTTGYYVEGNSGANCPANIVQCKITYKGIDYFVTIPVITVSYNAPYKVYLEPRTGFNYVTYSSDGRYPKYNDNKPFEIQITQIIDGIEENISLLHSNQYGVNFTWIIRGQVYDIKTGLWVDKIMFTKEENQNKVKLIPVSEYSGECVSTALECICKKKSDNTTVIGKIHIPIHCMLNRYANAAINGWDGNSVTVNEEDGYILTPQIGAGTKDENNRFTGMIMGSVKDNSNNGVVKTGLLGYDAGQQSLFLDSESGGAIFGKPSIDIEHNKPTGGQIIIDPQSDKSYLFSRDYWNSYNDKGFPTSYEASNMSGNGLLIDLATPQIKYGDGTKFGIDQYGNLTCRNLINSNGILSLLHLPSEKGVVGYAPVYGYYTTTHNYTTYDYTNKITYYAESFQIFTLIPENFTLVKAEVLVTSIPSVYPVYTGDGMYVRGSLSEFPNYVWGKQQMGVDGSGYCHCAPIMTLGVYAAANNAFHAESGAIANSGVFWKSHYADFSGSTLLGTAQENFIDADLNDYAGRYDGITQTLSIDITSGLIDYLTTNNTRIVTLAVAPIDYPVTKEYNITETKVSDYEYYGTARPKSPNTTSLTQAMTDITHKTGIVEAEVFLYGYYKINAND